MRTLIVILLAVVGLTATLWGMLLIAYPVVSAYGLAMENLHPALVKSYTLPDGSQINCPASGTVNFFADKDFVVV